MPENHVDLYVLNPAADLEARIAALCPDKDMYVLLTPEEDESGGAYLAQNETGSLLHNQQTISLIEQAMEVLDGLDASEYGGLYYSDNMWVLNVNILKTDPGVANLLPDAPDVIRLHEVKYSEAELRQLQDVMGRKDGGVRHLLFERRYSKQPLGNWSAQRNGRGAEPAAFRVPGHRNVRLKAAKAGLARKQGSHALLGWSG